MTHLGLFEGIGGFSLAARWMGWETVAWCEWNDFGQRVLRHHFPEAIGHGDITQTDFTPYANKIGILTGGFPCQPYSAAGKRRGKDDDRHLWPQMLRAIREIAPRYIVGENVLGLVNWNGGLVFDEVCADLEAEGYEVAPVVIPAAAKNAPHGRDRVWFIARRTTPDTDSDGQHQCNGGHEINTSQGGVNAQRDVEQGNDDGNAPDTDSASTKHEISTRGNVFTSESLYGNATDTDSTSSQCRDSQTTQERQKQSGRIESFSKHTSWEIFPTQPPVCGGDDGLPRQLDGITFPKWRAESIKAYGNAIVPQVAYQIFKAIAAHEQHHQPHP